MMPGPGAPQEGATDGAQHDGARAQHDGAGAQQEGAGAGAGALQPQLIAGAPQPQLSIGAPQPQPMWW